MIMFTLAQLPCLESNSFPKCAKIAKAHYGSFNSNVLKTTYTHIYNTRVICHIKLHPAKAGVLGRCVKHKLECFYGGGSL